MTDVHHDRGTTATSSHLLGDDDAHVFVAVRVAPTRTAVLGALGRRLAKTVRR